MKTMTCRQLGGPCDAALHGATSVELMNNGSAHVMDMVAKGDEPHKQVLAMMEETQKNPAMAKEWGDKFEKDFAATPEDQV